MMADKKHLYLVDGSAYIFRAYHRLPPLTDPEGTPVGAVYGYTTMLWKLAEDLDKAEGPTHLAVILDKSSHSFRNEIYDQYKANRPAPPEDLVPQFEQPVGEVRSHEPGAAGNQCAHAAISEAMKREANGVQSDASSTMIPAARWAARPSAAIP